MPVLSIRAGKRDFGNPHLQAAGKRWVSSLIYNFCLQQFCSPLFGLFWFVAGFVKVDLVVFEATLAFFHMAEYCDTLQWKEKRNGEYKACLNERVILRLLDHNLSRKYNVL